jgi:membrane protein YdbS with pleckstrin-like domain
VSDLTIRPTAKFLIARFIVTAIVYVAFVVWWYVSLRDKGVTDIFPAIALIIFLPAFRRLIARQLTKISIVGDRLRYETGFASKTTRTIQISKVQDVRVDQTPMQRMFGVGNISIETAGEASRLTIHDVDAPQTVADDILNRAQGTR